MNKCQCLTKNGKGPQCQRDVSHDQIYCYQHQNCQNPIPKVI